MLSLTEKKVLSLVDLSHKKARVWYESCLTKYNSVSKTYIKINFHNKTNVIQFITTQRCGRRSFKY